jgi:hypothetical protein
MLDMAESAEVVDEDGGSITYSLVFDLEKMLVQEDLESMKAEMKDEGIPEDEIEMIVSMVMEMFSQIEMEMSVDKSSGMPSGFRMHIELDFSSFESLFPEDMPPEGAKMIMDADFEVGDYGKEFNLELPAEAEKAIPIKDLEEMQEG